MNQRPAPNSSMKLKCSAKKRAIVTNCAMCDNARFVPHPDPEKAEFVSIPCPDCSQITKAIRKRYLAAPTRCPWCQGTTQANASPEVDEGIVTQEIDCTGCDRRWTDLYRLVDIRP